MRISYTISTSILFLTLLATTALPQTTFSDVAQVLGINHASLERYGGISFCDFDEDGFEDISVNSDSGYPAYVFKNNSASFDFFSPQLGLNDSLQSQLFLWIDYDNDGDRDLFLGHWNTYNRLYRNDGNFVLTEVTAQAGLSLDDMTTLAGCWGDYDNDGYLDLYFTNYSEFQRNYLYHNNGDGTFTDVTIAAGVQDTLGGTNLFKTPLAVVFVDFNLDGWQDIYVANDHYTRNTLYKNLGDGTFEDVSISSNANISGFIMGIAVGDYDNDGDFDMYVSNNPDGNYLLKNNGDETFTEVAASLGLSVNKICWGVNFFDYDNDADLDLYVSVAEGTFNYANAMFANNGDATFTQLFGIGLDEQRNSYGNAIGDFNNDGFCDIAVYNKTNLMNLYKNSGNNNNWIKLSLEGVISNREGVGSLVEFFINGQRYIRSTHCGISFLSQNSSTLTIGIGTASIVDSLKINWPSGLTDIVYNLPANQFYLLKETFGIVPVELTSFTASVSEGIVTLNWKTATETNNKGFEIQRRTGGSFVTIGYVEGHGTTTEEQSYSFSEAAAPGLYSYRLKQVDFDGSFEYSTTITVEVTAPEKFALDQNYPNPFNPSTKISFRLAADSKVNLKVFDVLGQEVMTLIDADLVAGSHEIELNSSNLNSGVYFYKIVAEGNDGENFSSVKKMIFNK